MTTDNIEILGHNSEIEFGFQKQSEDSFLTFMRGLKIDSAEGPRVFENVIAPFQRICFDDLADSLHAVRDGRMPDHRRHWIERTKKAAKDSDIAVCVLWLLAYPSVPVYIQIGAANKEQAAIVKDRMTRLVHFNPWLRDYVEIVQWEVRSKKKLVNGSPMATLDIKSADIAGAHGGTPELLIINELSHMTKWEFVENLMDNADGVPRGVVIIATNAGFKGTKAEVWRNNAIESDDWIAHMWSRPAPWHDPDTIADAKRRNTLSRYNRLWHGRWASGKGDALSEEDIDRCFRDSEGRMIGNEPGWEFIAGLDLGISHDHSGLVVLGVNYKEQIIRLAWMRAWAPPEGGEVNLADVEDGCRFVNQAFRLRCLLYDPSEAKLMAQRLSMIGVPMREMRFVGENLTEMATSLIQVIESGKLKCYDDEDGTLRRDFGKFNIVEKSYGYKLEAVSDQFGHADVGTALVICLPAAVQMLGGFAGLHPEDSVVLDDDEELTAEEIEAMPDSLKGILDIADEQEEDALMERDWDSLGDIL